MRRQRLLLLATLAISVVSTGLVVSWYGLVVFGRYSHVLVRYVGNDEIVFDRFLGFARPRDATTERIESGLRYTIFTDHLGARVNSAGLQTPSRVGILTVGDSFSEGYGIENEGTYTERLGRGLGVSVANFSLGSYSALQMMRGLERNVSLSPKVVILGLIEDDLRRSLVPCAPNFFPICLEVPYIQDPGSAKPRIVDVKGSWGLGTQLSVEILRPAGHENPLERSLLGLRLGWYELSKRRRDFEVPEITSESKTAAGLYVVARTNLVAKSIGAHLIVFGVGRLDGLPPEDLSDGWAPFPRKFLESLPKDVLFVDATEPVRMHYSRTDAAPLTLPSGNGHPKSLAHEIFARVLKDRIVASGILD